MLNRASGGDQEAFARLYDHCAPDVLGLLFRILRCRNLAEEVLREVFLQVWREVPLYRPDGGTVMAWLLTMARSRGVERFRRERSPLQQDAPPGLQEGERRRGLHWALAELPEEQRACIELALYEGLGHGEIATRLAVPLDTVKSRLHLGMVKIREASANGTPWVASRKSDRLRRGEGSLWKQESARPAGSLGLGRDDRGLKPV